MIAIRTLVTCSYCGCAGLVWIPSVWAFRINYMKSMKMPVWCNACVVNGHGIVDNNSGRA